MRIVRCLSLLLAGVVHAAPQKMNLVAIVTDDQAAWTLGCYGGREIATPNLDRLAASGALFENSFVPTPVCSPSRATYMTSLLGTQIGFTDWLNDEQARTRGVTPDTPTWPTILERSGYATGLVGKWHLGSSEKSKPWMNGLKEFTGNLGGGWPPNKVNFIDEKGGKHNPPGFSVEICTELAMQFVDAHKEGPFALLVHYREPHAAYVPMPEVDMETSRKAQLKVPGYPGLKQPYATNNRRDYYASIAAIDRNVGRLLEHLEKTGLAANTIVTFTGDHGYNVGEHGMQHKGNGRWITTERFNEPRPNMYDTSLRPPLLVRWPGAGKPGTRVREWVTNADMGATVLSMLGVEKPAGALPRSRDYSAAVKGGALDPALFPAELFGQYDLVNHPVKARMRMMRTAEWKLILFLGMPERNELYHLAEDPGEQTNVFGQAGTEAVVKELTAKLQAHMEQIKDPALPLLAAGKN